MILFVIVLLFIFVGVGLSWYFISRDHGEGEPIGSLWLAAGFGLSGAILAGIGEGFLISTKSIENPNQPLLAILGVALVIGAIEESFKFLPLAAFIYRKRYFNEHTDGIIYFALAGLGFGIPENILYALQFGGSTGFMRILITPIFHATTTAMVGYYLAKSKIERRSMGGPALALTGAILLHGLYDFGLISQAPLFVVLSLMITVAMSTMLFILFMRANETDRAMGLSRVGNNSFCPFCGYPNPKHKPYCAHCGKYA